MLITVRPRPQRWVWRALFACLGVALAASCSSPDEYEFVETTDAGPDAEPPDTGPPPPSVPVACGNDDDCAGFPSTQVCGQTGYCAECDPTREAELARCGTGLFCDPGGHCVVGCQDDSDCNGLTCDTARGLCTNCVGDESCTPGTLCTEQVCTPSCATSDTCPYGWSCCDGTCVNPQTDATGCGACGAVCTDGACWNGVCGNPPCITGTAECDGEASNGCETETASNPANCGRCHVACASGFCAGGMCTTMDCADGTADCNENETDRCETNLDTIDDCGTCRNSCSALNGEPSCDDGACAIACDDGFGDCDDNADTGCEIEFVEDPEHCGDCDTVCTNDNGRTECVDGECVPSCATGYKDCNGDPTDGCETNINTALTDCGECGVRCRPANSEPMCDDGVCTGACTAGFEDCNGDPDDGCEADLTAPETCGACGNACSDMGGMPGCDSGKCTITCNDGFFDCTGGVADGCETNLDLSPVDCGTCGNVCDSSMGTAVCTDGVCGISTCTYPYEECITDDGTRCETDLRENDQFCGNCGTNCITRFPHATGVCNAAACELDDCESGFADCNGIADDGCEVALNTTDNCRTCAETCVAVHGTNECTTSGCDPTCQSGWGDCDGNPNNGCETPLDTLFNCGACDAVCNKARASESCASGTCEIVMCDAGWGDCNDESTPNGCETQLNSLTNCGACGVMCSLAGGTESCGTGQCVLTGCDAGRADCSSQAGCETMLGTTSNCLGCGDACNAVNGTNTCNSTTGCNPVCNTGYKSCDGDRGNGCETNIRPSSPPFNNCGDCGVGCDLPNATETCSTGTCTVTSCSTGWFDCSSSAPGCETPSGTVTNCSACGQGCVNAHGGATCMAGSCNYTCDTGWSPCDGSAANGCETSTRTLTDCGTCGNPCVIAGSGETCATGTCVATMCDATSADCDGDINGTCETALGNAAHCRSCTEVCTNTNGTTSCNTTTGCTPVCSTGFKSCDSDPNNGCERNIRTLTDCGDCGVVCDFPNASETCGNGTCEVTGCATGYDECNGVGNGCQPLGTATNCASCGNACTNSHGSNVCGGSPGSYDCSPTCDTGWRSCDTNPDNGCERDVRTLSDCGNCGVTCGFAHGGESCATGSCVMTGCDSGWGDCTPGGDCETQLNTTAACGSCTTQCTNANGSTACTAGACAPTCNAGFKSCDSNLNNGCERNIRTLTDCGDCGVPCDFPNATESCTTGTCTFGACNADYGDCTASPGCETQLNTTAACGACNVQCTNSNGTTACTGSAGSRVCTPSCNTGFGNCDGNPNNGCEANLTSAAACGACGIVCAGATPNCVLTGSTYKCQAQITMANEVDGSASANTLNMTHPLIAGGATNRMIILMVVSESQGNGIAGARPDSVTYGGTAMTLAAEQAGVNSLTSGSTGTCTAACSGMTCYDWWGPDQFIYVLNEAGIGAKANDQPVVINAATSPSPDRMIANLIQLNGVRQTTPISAFNGGFLGTCAAADPNGASTIAPIVSMATTGSRILSFMSGMWTNGSPTFSVSPATGLTYTDLYNSAVVSDMRAFFRYVSAGTALIPVSGNFTVSFNSVSDLGRMTHLAVVVHPAQMP